MSKSNEIEMQLSQAFSKLIKSKGLDDIGVKDICEEAGVPRSTFYSRYTDKYDFVNKTLRRLLGNIVPPVKVHTIDEYYCLTMNAIMDYLIEYQDLLRQSNTVNGAVINNELESLFAEDIRKQLNYLEDRKNVPMFVPVDLVAEFYAGGLVSMCKWWVAQDKPYTKEDFYRYGQFLCDKGQAFGRLEY